MGLLGHQQLCAKIFVVVKGFLGVRLRVSHCSGTTWKDDSESPFLEMKVIKGKGENYSCPVIRNESF